MIEKSLSAITSIAAARRPGEAVVLGAHLEGPFLIPSSRRDGRALMLEGDPALAQSWAEQFKIVIATVAPEIPGGCDVIKALAEGAAACRSATALRRRRWPRRRSVVGSGFTHLFNAMSQMEHRSPGVAAYALAKGRFAEIIGDLCMSMGPCCWRPIVRFRAFTRLPTRARRGCRTEPCVGRPPRHQEGQRITLENGTTLAGSAITMLDAFRNLVSLGLSLDKPPI